MKSHLPVSLLLLFAFCGSQSVLAQTASMAGTVKDSTAAVVPEVKLTVRNNRTNASRSALTDRSGSYRIASLGPGSYDVVIEKLGFQVVEYPRVELTVDQVQSLDAILTPSAITEKVTVQGETVAPIDLSDAQVGNIVRSQQMEDLPMILRDPCQLILLSPGAIPCCKDFP